MIFDKSLIGQDLNSFSPNVCVIGVGGGGCNAVNGMSELTRENDNIKFIICNTDAQSLNTNSATYKIQLGQKTTRGLGAGANPEVGRLAAEESLQEIESTIKGADLLFITCGMGGGTGTGASPVIAKLAKEMGILTIGVVTRPFSFEGQRREMSANKGIHEISKYLDTLIVVSNQNLFRVSNQKTSLMEAFKVADNVLKSSITCISDLLFRPGFINLDFADMRTVMKDQGLGMITYGEAEGENRAIIATEIAIQNPLISEFDISKAGALLINITGGSDVTLFEVDEIVKRVRDEVKSEVNLFFGTVFDETINSSVKVSIIATGIKTVSRESVNLSTQSNNPVQSQRQEQKRQPEPSIVISKEPEMIGDEFDFEKTNESVQEAINTKTILNRVRDKFKKMESKEIDDSFIVDFDE